eukprot:2235501-Amphidinium_carterae.1
MVEFEDIYACDPNKTAKHFCTRNMPIGHWFHDIKTMMESVGSAAPCSIHDRNCAVAQRGEIDILAAGFPCAPFSGQRPDRYGSRRLGRGWSSHKQVHVLYELLQWIQKSRPCAVVLENVRGLQSKDAGSNSSPLEMILAELTDMGYCSVYVDMDVAAWHDVTRQRTVKKNMVQKLQFVLTN